jgi:hypothetical protein
MKATFIRIAYTECNPVAYSGRRMSLSLDRNYLNKLGFVICKTPISDWSLPKEIE